MHYPEKLHSMVAGLVCGVAMAATAAFGAESGFEWPREWIAFGPIPPDAHMAAGGLPDPSALLEGEPLRRIPDTLEIEGETYVGRPVSFDHGQIDFQSFFYGVAGQPHRRGERVYLFGRITMPRARRMTIGTGADWFMQWWLNGEPVFESLMAGNIHAPIDLTNHSFELALTEGEHVLAVFVAAGSSDWLLSAGGPRERAAAAASPPQAESSYREEMEAGRRIRVAQQGAASGLANFSEAAAAFRRAAALAASDRERARAWLEQGEAMMGDFLHADYDAVRSVFEQVLALDAGNDQDRAGAWMGMAATWLEENRHEAARDACERALAVTDDAHLSNQARLLLARSFFQAREYASATERLERLLAREDLHEQIAWKAEALQGAIALLPMINPAHPRLFISPDNWPGIRENAVKNDRDALAALRDRIDATTMDEIVVQSWAMRAMEGALVYRIDGSEDALEKVRKMLRATLDFFDERHAGDSRAYPRIAWLAAFDWVRESLPLLERRELAGGMLDYVWTCYVETRSRNRLPSWPHYYTAGMFWYAGLVLADPELDDVAYARALSILAAGLKNHRDRFEDMRFRADPDMAWQTNLDYDFGEIPNMHFAFMHSWKPAVGMEAPADWAPVGIWPEFALRMVLDPQREGDHYKYFNWAGHSGGVWGFGHAWKGHLPAYLDAFVHHFGATHPEQAAMAGYLRHRLSGPGRSGGTVPVFRFLLTGLNSAPAPTLPPDIPLARYYENIGLVLASSGFEEDETYLLFAPGGGLAQPYVRHDFDAGHFSIFRSGWLAMDTGARGAGLAAEHCRNYRHQTVAHNCILIRMEGEGFPRTCCGMPTANSAGQNRDPSHARVLAFESTDDYVYAATDLAPTYHKDKCAFMVRQLIYLPPEHIVVFDRVTSTRADYPKTWLLHTANEPVIEGDTFYADQDGGRLFCRTLLPADAVLEPIGGPGEEFWADGRNWPVSDAWWSRFGRGHTSPPEGMGRWRVDVTPGAEREEDVFLHLIETADQTVENMAESRVREVGERVELTFRTGPRTHVITLNKRGPVGGHIRITEGHRTIEDRPLTEEPEEPMPQSGLMK